MQRYIILVLTLSAALLSGCGSGTPTLTQAPPSTSLGSGGGSGTSGGSAATSNPSSGGTVIANIQALSKNWRSWGQAPPDYSDCSAPCSESSWEEVYGVADPSLSGNATMFYLEPKIPYADVLFSAGLIGQNSPQLPDTTHTLLPTLHNFIYDTHFYVANSDVTQALEFDTVIQMNGVSMNWGNECNRLEDGDWNIWDNANAKWVSTGDSCEFVQGWNHLTLKMQREPDNTLIYQSITLNGTTYLLNRSFLPGNAPYSWWGLAVNFQMDSNSAGSPYTAYLDNFSFTYW